jgi:hypothetical protein
MRAAVIKSQGSEFDDFLYAPICHDHEGMTLSMLSAIARQDIDPRSEAARLAQLPQKTAVEQIRDLLDALPLQTTDGLDCAEVAGRLSALLPRHVVSSVTPIWRTASRVTEKPAAAANLNWRFFCVYFCAMLLMNLVMAKFHAPLSSAASESSQSVVQNDADTRPNSNGTDGAARHADLASLVRHGAIPTLAVEPESAKSATE